ncbi:MAG: hypothetical protein A2X83_07105 [Desulfuromonadales bacterium GWD2_54_10]|nr:MAG: hypothetical protein A2X83_07105 [Desulfuromonadales bacterium GWD2_54_10]
MQRMSNPIHIAALLLLLLAISTPALAVTEVRSIPTRPGVTLDFLFMAPEQGQLRNALILFPGGNGAVPFRITSSGTAYGWSFLVRSADAFTKRGLAVATINPPSDHPTGMSAGFRESPEHAEDIAKLAVYLKSQGFERIFLVGNSRGTLSVASLATQLKDTHILGVVLTSSLEYDGFMRWLPLERLLQPVLMVHHREDACRVSSFSEAEKTRENLRDHTTVDFVEINGGAAARSEPCNDLSAHGFFGMEDKVVQVIADWVNGRKVPSRIE